MLITQPTYSYSRTIVKSVKFAVFMLLGILIGGLLKLYEGILDEITIGAIVRFVYDWLKNAHKLPLP